MIERKINERIKDRRMLNSWSLDKRIPVALVFTIIVQTAGGIWWASTINERVNMLTQQQTINANLVERVVKVEVLSVQNQNTLDKIDRKLDGFLIKK